MMPRGYTDPFEHLRTLYRRGSAAPASLVSYATKPGLRALIAGRPSRSRKTALPTSTVELLIASLVGYLRIIEEYRN